MQPTSNEDYRLIAITEPSLHPNTTMQDACRAAADGGVTAIQVRLKGASTSEVMRVTEELLGAVDVPVYVNDRLDVAWAAGAAGVHLGADDMPIALVEKVVPEWLRVGLSVGSIAEAAAAAACTPHYWSIGPFFEAVSKSDAGPPLGQVEFKSLADLAPVSVPVIAIGGINVHNAELAIRAGAVGVAVISAVFGHEDILSAARGLRDVLDEAIKNAVP